MKRFSSSKKENLENNEKSEISPTSDSASEVVQGKTYPRITGKHLFAELAAVLNLEKGIVFSIWQFFRRPGIAFSDYLKKNRRKYANPIRILVLTSAVLVFLNMNYAVHLDGITDKLTSAMEPGQESFSMGTWGNKKVADLTPEELVEMKISVRRVIGSVSSMFNWFTLLIVPFLAIFTRLFLRKQKLFLLGTLCRASLCAKY